MYPWFTDLNFLSQLLLFSPSQYLISLPPLPGPSLPLLLLFILLFWLVF